MSPDPPRRSDLVVFEVTDGRAVLLDASGTELITLNPVGTIVWNALDGTRDVDALARVLASEFPDVDPAQLVDDVRRFLDELGDLHLLSTDGDAGR